MVREQAVRGRLAWRYWRHWMPARFRARYERDMIRDHVERARARRSSRAEFWLLLLWDAAVTGMAARLEWRMQPGAAECRNAGTSARFVAAGVMRQLALTGRRLWRQPAFSTGVVATLALAIGANLTMFSIVDRLLLRPPAGVEDASGVRRVYVHGPTLFDPAPVHSTWLAYPEYAELRAVGAFTEAAAYNGQELTAGTGAEAERVRVELATASYFTLLGVTAALGRLYTPDDDIVDAGQPVVVLSHDYWQRRFGGDTDVIGRELAIGKGRYTVAGVAARGFTGVDLEAVDLWLPLHAAGVIESGHDWMRAAGWVWLTGLVRLRASSDPAVAAAEEEATGRIHAAREGMPARVRESRAVLASLITARGPNPMSEANIARVLLALAAMVLLIGCANVVNLLLARGVQRRRQFAVQRALGAGRARLAAELMGETLLLTIAAGALALFLARLVAPVVFQLLVPGAPPNVVAVDRTLAVAAAVVTFVVILIGLLPSYRASLIDPTEALRGRSGAARTAWLRRAMLFVQAAVSVMLLIGAGLFVRSLQRATSVDLGLALETLTVQLELQDGTDFGERLAPAIYAAYERVRAQPGVASATVTSIVPFGGGWGLQLRVPGREPIEATASGPFFISAGPDYFRTVGIALRDGRALTELDDRPGAELVTVVNEAMARLVWPDENALGKCLLIGENADVCTTVVGVADNFRTELTSQNATPYFYIAPHHPGIGFTAATALLVRVTGDAAAPAAAVRDAVRAASPDIRFVAVAPLSDRLEPQLRAWRVGAGALSVFAVLALLVAAAGLYAVLAFEVTQRRYELAIRSALGASGRDLVRALAARTLLFTVAGIAAGITAALLLGPVVQSLLFDVPATDPVVYAGAVLALGTAAVGAVTLPLHNARRADPMQVIREE